MVLKLSEDLMVLVVELSNEVRTTLACLVLD